jgi:uncharacterized lipoprotein
MKLFVQRLVLVAALGVGAVVLAGCASKEKKQDYETSPAQRAALEVPPDLTKPNSGGALMVPDAATQPAREAGASGDRAPLVEDARAPAIVNAPGPADEAALHIARDKVSLQLRDTLDSAWKRVGLALDRVGWVVEDRTADTRTYRVRQVDVIEPKKRKGFLGLFGGDEPVEKQREFLVVLTESADLVEVTLRDASGVPIARKEAQPLMELLYDQLR